MSSMRTLELLPFVEDGWIVWDRYILYTEQLIVKLSPVTVDKEYEQCNKPSKKYATSDKGGTCPRLKAKICLRKLVVCSTNWF